MIRATTPSIIISLPETVDLTYAPNIYVTFQQGDVIITKERGDDLYLIEDNIIGINFTQEETLLFTKNTLINVQVNWFDMNGSRIATKIKQIPNNKNLIGSVLS